MHMFLLNITSMIVKFTCAQESVDFFDASLIDGIANKTFESTNKKSFFKSLPIFNKDVANKILTIQRENISLKKVLVGHEGYIGKKFELNNELINLLTNLKGITKRFVERDAADYMEQTKLASSLKSLLDYAHFSYDEKKLLSEFSRFENPHRHPTLCGPVDYIDVVKCVCSFLPETYAISNFTSISGVVNKFIYDCISNKIIDDFFHSVDTNLAKMVYTNINIRISKTEPSSLDSTINNIQFVITSYLNLINIYKLFMLTFIEKPLDNNLFNEQLIRLYNNFLIYLSVQDLLESIESFPIRKSILESPGVVYSNNYDSSIMHFASTDMKDYYNTDYIQSNSIFLLGKRQKDSIKNIFKLFCPILCQFINSKLFATYSIIFLTLKDEYINYSNRLINIESRHMINTENFVNIQQSMNNNILDYLVTLISVIFVAENCGISLNNSGIRFATCNYGRHGSAPGFIVVGIDSFSLVSDDYLNSNLRFYIRMLTKIRMTSLDNVLGSVSFDKYIYLCNNISKENISNGKWLTEIYAYLNLPKE